MNYMLELVGEEGCFLGWGLLLLLPLGRGSQSIFALIVRNLISTLNLSKFVPIYFCGSIVLELE